MKFASKCVELGSKLSEEVPAIKRQKMFFSFAGPSLKPLCANLEHDLRQGNATLFLVLFDCFLDSHTKGR